MVDTIVRNLLSNALKFTDAGGTIEVTALQDKSFVEVAVSDTGIGMNQESIDKLFRIDVKSTRPGTAGEKGTGLGLILCKELVEKNGGEIGVESKIGEGTTFVFTLPATD
jgi:signal transduction histidine kinase